MLGYRLTVRNSPLPIWASNFARRRSSNAFGGVGIGVDDPAQAQEFLLLRKTYRQRYLKPFQLPWSHFLFLFQNQFFPRIPCLLHPLTRMKIQLRWAAWARKKN
jgi:hypothetical protein